MPPHPFADLTATEITLARDMVQQLHPRTVLSFKAITLEEPDKASMTEYLEAEHAGVNLVGPSRIAYCAYYIRGSSDFRTSWVDLSQSKVIRSEQLGPGVHGNVDFGEVVEVENAVMQDKDVLEEIEKLQLPANMEVIPEPWGFGSDGVRDKRRQYQTYMFVREKNKPDYNHYAQPLNFSPIFDPVLGRVVRIERIATGAGHDVQEATLPFRPNPPNEYVPEENNLRTDLRELHISQLNGPSFHVSPDRVLKWQKWHMRLCFNYREGLVLRDVRYDGQPLFYRISLSEMTVPYGDPRSPYHRKMAFDLGDVGAGLVANNLSLGCDCLGAIAYLDGILCDRDGNPYRKDNAVCIHEQDNGIGWKHSNYRTERACITRNRQLVLQTILTVSNYEYILAFIFNQAGELEYEVRATGILSTSAIDHGLTVDYGTVVHPGVLAAHHQHILSLRVDPALGSYTDGNRLVYQEAHAMPMDSFNPFGNGYRSIQTVVKKASGLDLDPFKNRVFLMQNANIKNPINGLPASYKIQVPPMQPLLAHPDSFHYRRAEFADHSIYVTKYREDELFCGGKFTNQSRGGEGIKKWVARGDKVLDEDIVVWIQFGLNHNPRIEDFPVMPVEIIKVHLKPVNFFTKNPALDVPPSTQDKNRSVRVAADGAACCQVKS